MIHTAVKNLISRKELVWNKEKKEWRFKQKKIAAQMED